MESSTAQQVDARVLVIVPAYNEAASIAAVLADLAAHAPWADVVVIDDGSADATAALAEAGGAVVLKHPINLGVGGAVQTGYLYACRRHYDVAVQFDGDGQHRADRIIDLVREIAAGADVVIGSRLLGPKSYRFPLARWIGSRILAQLVSRIARMKITDPTSGFRAASRRAIRFFAAHYPQLYLADTTESLVWAARQGMKLREIPTSMRMPRRSSITSLMGLVHTVRMCLAVLIDRIERRFPEDALDASNE